MKKYYRIPKYLVCNTDTHDAIENTRHVRHNRYRHKCIRNYMKFKSNPVDGSISTVISNKAKYVEPIFYITNFDHKDIVKMLHCHHRNAPYTFDTQTIFTRHSPRTMRELGLVGDTFEIRDGYQCDIYNDNDEMIVPYRGSVAIQSIIKNHHYHISANTCDEC